MIEWRKLLTRIALNRHMPVLLTIFFWLLILSPLPRRPAGLLLFAWPWTVECWLIAAARRKRELITDMFIVIYFWLFTTLSVGLLLHALNRPFRFVDEERLADYVDGFSWALFLFLAVVQHRARKEAAQSHRTDLPLRLPRD
ncbi:MAG: hypothetical protein IH624_06380 [Phycisphaerae bacterium]|nr:hypothetical protein [Phycisphaerae bacterium]